MSDQELVEAFGERAAIMEFDGELTRAEAEQAAYLWLVREVGFGVEIPEEIKRIAG